ncbi:TAP-like domain containing protein, partial [Amanita muscaria]
SQKLQWQDCYPDNSVKFQCARLLVPLNYSAPFSSSNQASIALIRTPSAYPQNSTHYKGPILFNPGGPGGSGVQFVLEVAPIFRAILGNAFDLVGFDPRGVSRSLPAVSFFNSSADRDVFLSRLSVYSVINASTNSIAEGVAGAHIIGALAEATNSNTGGYLDNINTEFTARDMLTITQAHGRDKLQYWGFSYGSVLGATFAALFPDKVERLIIDGVDDAENYYTTAWLANLLDTDKVMQTFFDGCFAAGPSNCAFYASSPEAISQNLQQIYKSVASRPIFVVSNSTSSYGVVDYSVVRISVFSALYQPYALFAPLAQSLAALSKGDGRAIWDLTQSGGPSDISVDPEIAIICNDGNSIPGTIEDAESHFNDLQKISQFADSWASIRLLCSGWPALPKHFRGPFTVNTSFPLLVIGNTADPVTPLANAKKMSAGFAGSVVLTQDSPGHSSLAAPSTCTAKYVRAYFENGTLPQGGTVCPV